MRFGCTTSRTEYSIGTERDYDFLRARRQTRANISIYRARARARLYAARFGLKMRGGILFRISGRIENFDSNSANVFRDFQWIYVYVRKLSELEWRGRRKYMKFCCVYTS